MALNSDVRDILDLEDKQDEFVTKESLFNDKKVNYFIHLVHKKIVNNFE